MHKLHLPRLGQTMEKGTILRWAKEEGDSFELGEVLFEVETDKLASEVEAKLPGTLARITVPEGEEHLVGTLLAVVADPGEEPSDEQIEEAIAEESAASEEAPVEEPTKPPDESGAAPARAAGDGERVRAMPRARAKARELDVDLQTIEGSGKGGVITTEDVEAAAAGKESEDGGPKVLERRPLSGLGKTMAEVVSRGWREIPQFVQMVELDASALVERRRRKAAEIKQSHGVDLSYTDLFLEAVVGAVEDEPLANSSLVDGEILMYEDVNVSMAVATDAGLLVPVVWQTQGLSLGELASKFREVAEKARTGSLSSEDLEGGTITLSNLGMHGVEAGTPLVTLPQAAVVFFGAMVERPVAVDGRVEIRSALSISIGFDHRILDGASAARFTRALRRRLERS